MEVYSLKQIISISTPQTWIIISLKEIEQKLQIVLRITYLRTTIIEMIRVQDFGGSVSWSRDHGHVPITLWYITLYNKLESTVL